jgi:hypothetical protein
VGHVIVIQKALGIGSLPSSSPHQQHRQLRSDCKGRSMGEQVQQSVAHFLTRAVRALHHKHALHFKDCFTGATIETGAGGSGHGMEEEEAGPHSARDQPIGGAELEGPDDICANTPYTVASPSNFRCISTPDCRPLSPPTDDTRAAPLLVTSPYHETGWGRGYDGGATTLPLSCGDAWSAGCSRMR